MLLCCSQSNKSDLIRIQIEKEQMEKTQREGALYYMF